MGKGTQGKLPYDPRTGQLASVHDTGTWATLDEAQSWAAMNGGDGVGIMLCAVGDVSLAGAVLGACRNRDTGDIAPLAQEIIDRLGTYAEVSLSGTGVTALFTIASADLPALEELFEGKHGRAFKNGGDGERLPAIVVYRGKRYFTVTEELIGPTDELRLVDVADLRWLIGEAGPKFAGQSATATDRDEGRSAIAIRAGAVLKSGGVSNHDKRSGVLGHEDAGLTDRARTKGLAAGEREMRRVLDEAGGEAATDRPTIRLVVGETERVVDEIEAALIASSRGLYRRAGLIVAAGFDKMQTWDGDTVEVQIIEERENYALLEDIEAAADLVKFNADEQKWMRTRPPMWAGQTLKQRRTKLRLPNLVGLINCPTIKANGVVKIVNPALVNRPRAMELKLPHSASPELDDFDDLPPDFDDVDVNEAVPTRPVSARPMPKESVKKVVLRDFYSPPPPTGRIVLLRRTPPPPPPPPTGRIVLLRRTPRRLNSCSFSPDRRAFAILD